MEQHITIDEVEFLREVLSDIDHRYSSLDVDSRLRHNFQRKFQNKLIDLHHPEELIRDIKDIGRYIESQVQGICQDFLKIGLRHLALKLESLFELSNFLQRFTSEQSLHYFSKFESVRIRLENQNGHSQNCCFQCRRTLELQHLRFIAKPLIQGTTDPDQINRLKLEEERKQIQIEELIRQDLFVEGTEDYYHNLKNILEEKDFYLHKSASESVNILEQIINSVASKQEQYLMAQLSNYNNRRFESAGAIIENITALIRKDLKALAQSVFRNHIVKYSHKLAEVHQKQLKNRLVSTGVQTVDWKTLEMIRILENKNDALFKSITLEKIKSQGVERHLMETLISLEESKNLIQELREEGRENYRKVERKQLELNVKDAKINELETIQKGYQESEIRLQDEIQELKNEVYEYKCEIIQLKAECYAMKHIQKLNVSCQTNPNNKNSETQTTDPFMPHMHFYPHSQPPVPKTAVTQHQPVESEQLAAPKILKKTHSSSDSMSQQQELNDESQDESVFKKSVVIKSPKKKKSQIKKNNDANQKRGSMANVSKMTPDIKKGRNFKTSIRYDNPNMFRRATVISTLAPIRMKTVEDTPKPKNKESAYYSNRKSVMIFTHHTNSDSKKELIKDSDETRKLTYHQQVTPHQRRNSQFARLIKNPEPTIHKLMDIPFIEQKSSSCSSSSASSRNNNSPLRQYQKSQAEKENMGVVQNNEVVSPPCHTQMYRSQTQPAEQIAVTTLQQNRENRSTEPREPTPITFLDGQPLRKQGSEAMNKTDENPSDHRSNTAISRKRLNGDQNYVKKIKRLVQKETFTCKKPRRQNASNMQQSHKKTSIIHQKTLNGDMMAQTQSHQNLFQEQFLEQFLRHQKSLKQESVVKIKLDIHGLSQSWKIGANLSICKYLDRLLEEFLLHKHFRVKNTFQRKVEHLNPQTSKAEGQRFTIKHLFYAQRLIQKIRIIKYKSIPAYTHIRQSIVRLSIFESQITNTVQTMPSDSNLVPANLSARDSTYIFSLLKLIMFHCSKCPYQVNAAELHRKSANNKLNVGGFSSSQKPVDQNTILTAHSEINGGQNQVCAHLGQLLRKIGECIINM